jgi:hypothetical protein
MVLTKFLTSLGERKGADAAVLKESTTRLSVPLLGAPVCWQYTFQAALIGALIIVMQETGLASAHKTLVTRCPG